MNKAELTEAIIAKREKDVKKYDLSKAVVERIVNDVFTTAAETLAKGEEVRIDKFGTFSVLQKKERTGTNPQTGEAIKIEAHNTVKFAPTSGLKKAVADVK